MDLIDYFAGNIATSNWYAMFRAYNRDVSGKKHHVVDAMMCKERWAFLPTVQSKIATCKSLFYKIFFRRGCNHARTASTISYSTEI
jgi:hypothetical protein